MTSRAARATEQGQAVLLILGILLGVAVGALVLGGIARGIGAHGERQRAADLAALAGARAMRDAYPGVFSAPALGGRSGRRHLERAGYLALGRRIAEATAARNGARDTVVAFPGGGLAPVRIRVTVRDPVALGGGAHVASEAIAEAELVPPGAAAPGSPGAGEYRGPFAVRQGERMRPDTALAFDRLAAAAHRAGIELIIASAFRTDADQGRLFAAHADPKWVARPGTSLHRLGTELDLGPPSAYGWLARHAPAFHLVRRYAWEPWHFGLELNAGTTSVGYRTGAGGGERAGALPVFVPERFAPALGRAAQRWSVSAALLAAQLFRESGFNPFARSGAGAQGIAQFLPSTARAYGLRDPFDAEGSIDAQAHLMRDLLRSFGAVPLALAAYNAGPARVRACGCVPAIPETQAYVADILGLLAGAGDPAGAGGLTVRLVR
ncbi:MAG: peptidase and DD-carboxypeptidase VanY/endolysin [Solirubrobacterales bacterium]|nr:peptidase and DD-carboxypeptidase VanY/endolysin [Solirubrobacterales bacterium]